MSSDQSQLIATLNDRFRSCFFVPSFGPRAVPGRFVCTAGIAALSPETQIRIWGEIATFSGFSEDNDPHGEHDFGALEVDSKNIFWKIDYYADQSCTYGSEHPADPARSFRVLTIMLASEY